MGEIIDAQSLASSESGGGPRAADKGHYWESAHLQSVSPSSHLLELTCLFTFSHSVSTMDSAAAFLQVWGLFDPNGKPCL